MAGFEFDDYMHEGGSGKKESESRCTTSFEFMTRTPASQISGSIMCFVALGEAAAAWFVYLFVSLVGFVRRHVTRYSEFIFKFMSVRFEQY